MLATDFNSLGVISGTDSANLILGSNSGTDIIFGAGYNTPAYQEFYTVSNLSQYYSPPYDALIRAPSGFVDATDQSVLNGSRAYSVYNLVVKGAGTYVFQVSDHNNDLNKVGGPTVDLMAALYVKSGSTTAFNPSNALTNLVMVSDDNGGILANPYALFYQNSSSDCITMSLVYFPWSSAPAGQLVDITVSGPGRIATSCSALGPRLDDTQASLHALASKLRSGFTQQAMATNFANMNTYDCDLFDSKGVCVSVGGQQTYVDNPSSNLTSTVVVAGYKVSPQIRIGGFLNQNLNNNTVSSVHISNANPLMGLFAVWNQNENRLGYQVKVANAYQDKDVTTIREVIDTSEAGTGSTTLNTQSYVGELSYAFLANEDKTLVRPYAALRYTRIKQDGYTENAGIQNPLTYAALEDRSTVALVGVKLNHKLAEKLVMTGSLGIEQDIYHHVDNLTATGVANLTSENFNDNIKRTRPVASIGAYYMPVKNQRISGDVYYQQLPFQSTGSTTAYVNYTIGF